MFVFLKTFRALFSCNTCLGIGLFALLQTIYIIFYFCQMFIFNSLTPSVQWKFMIHILFKYMWPGIKELIDCKEMASCKCHITKIYVLFELNAPATYSNNYQKRSAGRQYRLSYCICGALRDLVLFVKFKKREKHTRRSVTFSKGNTPPWVFSTFFKLYK